VAALSRALAASPSASVQWLDLSRVDAVAVPSVLLNRSRVAKLAVLGNQLSEVGARDVVDALAARSSATNAHDDPAPLQQNIDLHRANPGDTDPSTEDHRLPREEPVHFAPKGVLDLAEGWAGPARRGGVCHYCSFVGLKGKSQGLKMGMHCDPGITDWMQCNLKSREKLHGNKYF